MSVVLFYVKETETIIIKLEHLIVDWTGNPRPAIKSVVTARRGNESEMDNMVIKIKLSHISPSLFFHRQPAAN